MDSKATTLLPQPWKVREKHGSLNLGGVKQLAFTNLFDGTVFATAGFLRDALAARFAHTMEVKPAAKQPAAGTVLLGLLDDPAMRKALPTSLKKTSLSELGPEGYVLAITPAGAVIAGADGQGLFWGVQTFLQLLERAGNAWSAACAEIVDRPRHPFRAVHLYLPPRSEIEHLKRLFGYLASIKINTVILELGGALELKRHPEINKAFRDFCQVGRDNAYGPNPGLSLYHPLHGCYGNSTHTEQGGFSWITQDDMREILRAARQHHLRVIPEVQSLSHSYWLCMAHPEVAERQNEPFPAAYCPSNPRTYELLFDVIDEVLEVMESEWVMIGHDEWYHYSICPRCRTRTGTDLLVDDVNKLHAHLTSRGVKCMMWCDLLLDPREVKNKTHRDPVVGEVPYGAAERVFVDDAGGRFVRKTTAGAVDQVPDDILMCDWHFSLTPDTQDYFARHGKTIVFGNFSSSFFDKSPRRMGASNVKGGIYSTWFENSQKAMAIVNWTQSVVPAADMFWSNTWRPGLLADRRPAYDAFWSANRDRLYDSTLRLVSRDPAIKARTMPLDLSKAQRAANAPAVTAPPALSIKQIDGPVAVKISRTPLVLTGSPAEQIILPIGRQLRGIAFLMRWLPGEKKLDGQPVYSWARYDDFYSSREVGRCRVETNLVPTSPVRKEVRGFFNFVLGLHVAGKPGGGAGFADRIQIPGQEDLFLYEWRHHNPDYYRIERLVFKAGRSGLDGQLVIYGAALIL